MSILVAILIFSFIIIFHELGHFIFAKAFDVRVNEFTLGLGPTVFSVQGKETKFCLNLLPFGGSCVMEGEEEESEDDRAFNKKALWKKAVPKLSYTLIRRKRNYDDQQYGKEYQKSEQ